MACEDVSVMSGCNDILPVDGSVVDDAKASLLDRVAKSNAHFKSQQLGEPDLSYEEKWQIASEILKNPSLFLYRFCKFLSEDDLMYFDQFKGDYEIDFYLRKISKNCDERKKKVRTKNRRYEALRRLVNEGEYFSDAEMEKRNPLLYEQMIGQYLTDEEKQAAQASDISHSSFTRNLMEDIERSYIDDFKRQQEEEEEEREKLYNKNNQYENDIDEDDTENYSMHTDEINTNSQIQISDEEKQMLREEFLSSMHQSFLLGKDTGFDYSAVDDNEDFDDLNGDCDEEDRYFDSEEPDNLEQPKENDFDDMEIM